MRCTRELSLIKTIDWLKTFPRQDSGLQYNPAFKGIDKVQTIGLSVSGDIEEEVINKLSHSGVYRIVPLGETYLRTSYETYDGLSLPAVFTYTIYVRRGYK